VSSISLIIVSAAVLYSAVLPPTEDRLSAERAPSPDHLPASTFLGGSGEEGWIYSGEVDNAIAADGSILVAGITASSDFPTRSGCYECTTCGSQDLFIARFSPDLSELLSVAVIGGSGDDQSPQICVHGSNIYLAGLTYSEDFPTTPGAFRSAYSGNGDIFVAKFDAELTTLLASTYLGSPSFDGYYPSLAIDDLGNVFIASNTPDEAFPTAASAYCDSIAGLNDCFVVRLSNDLSSLTAGTFIGGRYEEKAGIMAIAQDDNVVLATASESDDYPTTAGAYETDFHGPPQPGEYIHDVTISIFNNDLSSLVASTYVGDSDYEGASLLTIGQGGSIFVGGHTSSPGYPVTAGVIDPVHNGTNEFFITRMSSDLTTLEASTFLTPGPGEGSGFVYRTDMTSNTHGEIVLVGSAFDDSVFCTPSAYDSTFSGGASDIHVAVLSSNLTAMAYASYLGGTGDEGDASVVAGQDRDFHVASYTSSGDFPMVGSPWQTVHGGGSKDCVAARFLIPCCGVYTGGYTGNTDCSADGKRNLSDITRLIDHVYIEQAPLCCPANGNTSGDAEGKVNLSDITALIDHVYVSQEEIAVCP